MTFGTSWSSRTVRGAAGALGLLLVGLAVLGAPGGALAQDEAAPVAEEEAPEVPAPEADPPPAQTPTEPSAGAREEESYLAFFFRALGWRYTIAFLFISFCLVALLVMNIVSARRDNVMPAALIDAFEDHLNSKEYQEAYDLAKSDESFLGRVLSAGLARLSAGYPQAVEAMQEVGEDETMKLEHRLSYIALIASISPMVGLLGTVDGMVGAFTVIATNNQTPSPAELAGKISTALITTLVGLWLAIPAIAVHGILRNRLSRLVLEVGVVSESLMSRFQNVGKKTA